MFSGRHTGEPGYHSQTRVLTRVLRISLTFAAAAVWIGAATPSHAAGTDSPPPKPVHDKTKSAQHDKTKSKQTQNNREDAWQVEYRRAVTLIKADKFADGLQALEALNRPDDANVLNYMGYANRKLGNMDKARTYYEAALKINPDHKGALEYYGEFKVIQGDIEAARRHLVKLEVLCGTSCEEYRDLKEAIRSAGQ